jgi:nucleotide-binding universal stress UspA family protein
MYHHILVPLDGSTRAEKALPIAARIARHSGAEISLLRANPPLVRYNFYYPYPIIYSEDLPEALEKEAREYLEKIAQSQLLSGIPVHTYVVSEIPPTQAILDYAESHSVDLTVLCSHGYTGLKRWALGSVAQKVARHSTAPVLVLRDEHSALSPVHDDEAQPMRVLVALDGSSFAEAALMPAAQLISALCKPSTKCEMHLLHVVQSPSEHAEPKSQMYDTVMRRDNRDEAERYLSMLKDKLSKELDLSPKPLVVSSVIENQDVASTLIHFAEGQTNGSPSPKKFDVFALTTHGRSGIERWIIGSIAERVLEGTHLPVLIVRPSASTATVSPVSDSQQ